MKNVSLSLLALAAFSLGAYVVAELAGLRDWVSVLSGTPVPGVDYESAFAGGAFYVLTWFGAVLVAPVLTLAAGLNAITDRAFRRT